MDAIIFLDFKNHLDMVLNKNLDIVFVEFISFQSIILVFHDDKGAYFLHKFQDNARERPALCKTSLSNLKLPLTRPYYYFPL